MCHVTLNSHFDRTEKNLYINSFHSKWRVIKHSCQNISRYIKFQGHVPFLILQRPPNIIFIDYENVQHQKKNSLTENAVLLLKYVTGNILHTKFSHIKSKGKASITCVWAPCILQCSLHLKVTFSGRNLSFLWLSCNKHFREVRATVKNCKKALNNLPLPFNQRNKY